MVIKISKVPALIACLEILPSDHKVCTNHVENLAVMDSKDSYVGYIDLTNDKAEYHPIHDVS